MKVVVCLALMLAVVCAEPKAPYLPSGWKPDGPAFLLPSETQKPDDNPLKSTIEVEASGSDFLREYGPPAKDVTVQALPEVSTEQSFSVKSEAREEAAQNQEVEINEQVKHNEQQVENNEQQVENNEQVENNDQQVETNEQQVESNAAVKNKEQTVENNAQAVDKNENSFKTVNVQTAVENDSETQDVSANEITKEQRTQNIQEALNNLGQDISSQQVKSTEGAEAKSIQQESGVPAESPAGFLEYGPPGFREYGPPQDLPTSLIRSSLQHDSALPTIAAVPLNTETRRRRFSPKFRVVPSQ